MEPIRVVKPLRAKDRRPSDKCLREKHHRIAWLEYLAEHYSEETLDQDHPPIEFDDWCAGKRKDPRGAKKERPKRIIAFKRRKKRSTASVEKRRASWRAYYWRNAERRRGEMREKMRARRKGAAGKAGPILSPSALRSKA